MNRIRSSRRSRGISGIFVALILFGLLFVAAANYYLFALQSNLSTSQAGAARQDSLLQARQENLALTVRMTGGSTLVLSAANAGGIPTSISSIYIADNTGRMITPPGVMGQAPATNVSSTNWPITLNIGATTSGISGCAAGKTGCNIALLGYSYTSGTVYVKVLTARGNLFSSQFPPVINGGVTGNSLVVTMVATPTQLFSCSSCITVTITAYNFASSPVTGLTFTPNPPTASTTGTATVSGGVCGGPVPSSTIPAYSGSGTAPSVTITCTYSAQTGQVGGFASFSGFAQGTLNGKTISSALAISNNIQIGGTSNTTIQGAFSINFFFFRSSSCFQAGGNWHTPCVIPAFTGVNNLPQSATISGGSNHYVAFYVQVTNNYPATLEILQYTFLQLDASHPPPIVGNESDFWIAGAPSTYNSQSYYYPTYGPGTPSLAAYTGNEVTCAESAPSYNPSGTALLYPGGVVVHPALLSSCCA